MKKNSKLLQPLLILGGAVSTYLVFKALGNKKARKSLKLPGWINWEIEFSADTTEKNKVKAIKTIKKNIIAYCAKYSSSTADSSAMALKDIKFLSALPLSNQNTVVFTATATFDLVAKEAFRTPPPPPPPPPFSEFKVPGIDNIKDFNLNVEQPGVF